MVISDKRTHEVLKLRFPEDGTEGLSLSKISKKVKVSIGTVHSICKGFEEYMQAQDGTGEKVVKNKIQNENPANEDTDTVSQIEEPEGEWGDEPEIEHSEPQVEHRQKREKEYGGLFDTRKDEWEQLNHIMEVAGIPKKNRNSLIEIISLAPRLQSPNGMYNFLMNSGGKIAKAAQIIVEAYFGNKQMEAERMHLGGPVLGGMGGFGGGYGQEPDFTHLSSGDRRGGRYTKSRGRFADDYEDDDYEYRKRGRGYMGAGGEKPLTQADVLKALEKAREKWDRERREEEDRKMLDTRFERMEERFAQLVGVLAENKEKRGGKVIRRPVQMDGEFVIGEDGNYIMEEIITDESGGSGTDPMLLMKLHTMEKRLADREGDKDSETKQMLREIREENRRLQTRIEDKERKAEQAELIRNFKDGITPIKDEVIRLRERVNDPSFNSRNDGVSEQTQLQMAELKMTGDRQIQILKNMDSKTTKVLDIADKVVNDSKPPGAAKTSQWSDKELREIGDL